MIPKTNTIRRLMFASIGSLIVISMRDSTAATSTISLLIHTFEQESSSWNYINLSNQHRTSYTNRETDNWKVAHSKPLLRYLKPFLLQSISP